MWSDFNAANRTAMLRSEVISWPVTMAILVLAFGSLVAAGLPLMLTMIGLLAAAGSLYLGTQVMPVSIWAMNFALMFALALGIDYALFIVYRFRGAFFGSRLDAVEATAQTMDTAGKAVLFSGLTVLISLSAVMLVPSPAFRSMSLGIMLAVLFVLAATLTLLPAVLARLGPKVDKLSLPWAHSGEHRSPRFAAWGERLWRRPIIYGIPALGVLLVLAFPVTQLRTAMPSIKVVPQADSSRIGYQQVQSAFGPGATGPLQLVVPTNHAAAAASVAKHDPGIGQVLPAQRSGGYALLEAIPTQDPSNPAVGQTIDRLRSELPSGSLVGGAVAENHDLQAALAAKTPLVIAVVLGLGFLLLLVALQAPLIAAVGVVTNLLATGAAFGVAKWIFQDGVLHSLLGFQPQGFLDAWGPVFFFAMIFAISMDYTVFLLSSAKEHWDRTGSAKDAMVGGLAHSGRVIFAAGAVMVAVFFTFAYNRGGLPLMASTPAKRREWRSFSWTATAGGRGARSNGRSRQHHLGRGRSLCCPDRVGAWRRRRQRLQRRPQYRLARLHRDVRFDRAHLSGGAEVDPDDFRDRWKASASIGLVSFAGPFVVAGLIAYGPLGWDTKGGVDSRYRALNDLARRRVRGACGNRG